MKRFFQFIFGCFLIAAMAYGYLYVVRANEEIPSGSVCRSGDKYYTKECENIGKTGYLITKDGQEIVYGRIVGVVWRPRGQEIRTLGGARRHSDRNEYYYIFRKDGSKEDIMERVSYTKVR